MARKVVVALCLVVVCPRALIAEAEPPDRLPGTRALELKDDPAAAMVDGINRWLEQHTKRVRSERRNRWLRSMAGDRRDVFRRAARRRLARILGVRDDRVDRPAVEVLSIPGEPQAIAAGRFGQAYRIRWRAFGRVHGEGLWLEPLGTVRANVIFLPDADWLPEQAAGLAAGGSERSRFVLPLLASGCRVFVPCLISRDDRFSGNPAVRFTNQPHREFVYRGAYELGRHVIGYELLKVLALIDWLEQSGDADRLPIAVAGYGEGGLLTLYAAAVDERIDAALVSGYVGPRETLWAQPIYRNVWTLVRDFGDAEVLSLIAPRPVVVEAAAHPAVDGPPRPRDGRAGAAPGAIRTPPIEAVRSEVDFARKLARAAGLAAEFVELVQPDPPTPGSQAALERFANSLGVALRDAHMPEWRLFGTLPDPADRQQRQLQEMIDHTHWAWWQSQKQRERFWRKADHSSLEKWLQTTQWYRDYLHREVIGKLPEMAPQYGVWTRKWREEPGWIGYEVMLDVYPPDVFAYGILLVPRNVSGRRPVVVCQHGLEGRPEDTITRSGPGFGAYQAFAARLAEQGYVVYAPQNPYIGRDRFRVINRRANPLGLSLFSFIVEQHRRTIQWLRTLPFVDPSRIAFYGLSYGGKTAMRVPAILKDEYCLSICSADFNEWIWKNTSYTDRYSYVFTIEYEMFEFDLGNTFNYGELAALIAPRPFMVERGHRDGVAPDEWVAYEYARVRRLYVRLGIPERTEIEFFDGPHRINAVGTFRFLRRYLLENPLPVGPLPHDDSGD